MKVLFTIIMAMTTFLSVFAHKFSYTFNDIPVSEALVQILRDHSELNISLIYNELDDYHTSVDINTDDVYEAIKLTIGRNPIKIIEKNGIFYVEAFQHGVYKYIGRTINNNLEPVIAATVVLLNPQDSTFITYGITDDDGYFFIPCDRKSVIAKISSIGYQPKTIHSQSFNLGTIEMEELPVKLNSVTVIADRVIQKKDGMIITPRKSDIEFASSAYDVIYNIMIPGINVDNKNGTITRLGSEVAVYIDGRRADSNDIESLPPGSIKRMEYIDVPSGKYIRDDAVINIITNRNDGRYLSAVALQNICYSKGKYSVKAQQTSGTTTYSLTAEMDNANFNNNKGHVSELYKIDEVTLNRKRSVINSPVKYDNEFFRFRVNDRREKRNISTAVTLRRLHTPQSVSSDLIHYDESEAVSRSSVKETALTPSIDLSGEFLLPHNGTLSVTANGRYSCNRYRSTFDLTDFSSLSNVREDYWTAYANANYNRPLGSGSATIDVTDNFQHSNAIYSGTYPSVQNLSTNEFIANAGYIVQFGNKVVMNARAGISWIKYRLVGQSLTSRTVPRGSLIVRYNPINNHALTLNFNAGNSYPTASTLNSADQVVNEFLIKQGNPSYTPSLILNSAMMYNYFSRRLNIQLMYINNKFTHMLLPYYYTDGDKIISTFDNNSTLHQNLAVFFGSLDLWDCLTLKTELAVIDNRFTHSPSAYRHHTTLRASFDATYKWKKLMVSAGFKSKEKELTTNGILSESYNSWRSSVRYNMPNWLFEIGAENLFSHGNYLHQSFINEVYSYKSATYNRMSQSNVYVKITYRLNRGKKQKITGMDADESRSSAILK